MSLRVRVSSLSIGFRVFAAGHFRTFVGSWWVVVGMFDLWVLSGFSGCFLGLGVGLGRRAFRERVKRMKRADFRDTFVMFGLTWCGGFENAAELLFVLAIF